MKEMIEAFILACAIGGLISWAAWHFTRHFTERSWWLLTLAGVLVLAFSRLIVFPGLKHKFINNWPLVYAIMAAAIFGCAVQLYRFSRNRKHSLPVATILIIGVTGLITGLQFVFPEVLADFRRNPEALRAGEWWRMVTPLFVQWAGWPHACANGVGAVFLCPLAERFYGKRILALYFVPGILGEIFAYQWAPNGAGSSLGLAGVLGSLFAFTLSHRSEISSSARMFSILGIAGAVVMCFNRDAHGPPILIGVLLASLMTRLWPNPSAAANRRPALQSDGSAEVARDCCSRPGVSGGGR
jgi:membrane associated rhomboid family serine protease